MKYLYHIHEEKLIGEHLVPLNTLKNLNYEQYISKVTKYNKRSNLLNFKIPKTNKKWGDFIFLSPQNPNIVWNYLENLGFAVNRVSFIKIPIDQLDMNYAIFYKHELLFNDYLLEESLEFIKKQFNKISKEDYNEIKEITDKQKEYFSKFDKENIPILFFVNIPFILYSKNINIDIKSL